MSYNFYYGSVERAVNVTEVVLKSCVKGGIIYLPASSLERETLFGDPFPGVHKAIFIQQVGEGGSIFKLDCLQYMYIDTTRGQLYNNETPDYIREIYPQTVLCDSLSQIQKGLRISHGTFQDEYPEQKIALRYLRGNEKVLEIGGNIGRNSLIIGYILNKNKNTNFVTLECDTESAAKLVENRDANKLTFHVEASALSKRPLIQKGWDTIESATLLDGYTKVSTLTVTELRAKYGIAFDTLVIDCEGAFYWILQDMPEIIEGISLLLVENDYKTLEQKEWVDSFLRRHNFHAIYKEQGPYWSNCADRFYEVWQRITL
jgi:FkbM family methyltransferase